MNLAAVAGLPSRPINSVWYRAIEPRHLSAALNYSHTRRFASRYYEGPTASTPFDILYFAENPVVAQFEVGALFGSSLDPGRLLPNPARSWLILNVQVQLTRVADLTDVAGVQAPLETSAQELTGDWEGYRQRNATTSVPEPVGVAPTQHLGAALYSSGLFEGFLTISARLPYYLVLGVFPGRLLEGNFVRYSYQDSTGQLQALQIP